jgi:hypothetical protein
MVLLAVLSSCLAGCFRAQEKSETTSAVGTSTVNVSVTETSESAPTPIPTYAPGTELYGMLSVTGEVVVEPKYEYLDLFSEEGLARFEDHGLWGFVNTDGEEVIPAKYEDANNFSEGLAAVKVDGLWGFIDTTGEMVIEPQFERVEDGFRQARCAYEVNGKKGIIDRNGDVVLDPLYESIDLYSHDYFIADQRLILDRDGKVIEETEFSNIYANTDSGFYFTSESGEAEQGDVHMVYDILDRYPPRFFDRYIMGYMDRLALGENMLSLIRASEDGKKWGLFDTDVADYLLDPIYEHIDLLEGEGFYAAYAENEIVVFDIENQVVLASIDRTNSSGEELVLKRAEYDFIVFETYSDRADGIKSTGVMNMQGELISSRSYSYQYVIALTPNGTFSTYDLIKNRSTLYDSDGALLSTYEDLALICYLPEFDSWVVSDNYHLSEVPNYGLMNSDGAIFSEPNPDEYFNCMHNYYCENIWVKLGVQWPTHFPVLSSKRGLMSSSGFSGHDLSNWSFDWIASREIYIITENDNGHMGLVAWDGKVLFESQECKIFYPERFPDRRPFVDIDYLIYTKKV